MKHLLPDEKDVVKLLSMLFGDELAVTAPKEDVDAIYTAIYVDSDANPGAIISCDASFAASAGSALSMLPPDAAAEAASADALSQSMLDNFYEVMNICTRLVIGESTPHLRLSKLCRQSETSDEDAIKEDYSSSCFQVTIPRYGAGGLMFQVT